MHCPCVYDVMGFSTTPTYPQVKKWEYATIIASVDKRMSPGKTFWIHVVGEEEQRVKLKDL
ncbi:hypothetical protein KKB99_05590 [bacterium]|nr:hypothetical protein [bacterium]